LADACGYLSAFPHGADKSVLGYGGKDLEVTLRILHPQPPFCLWNTAEKASDVCSRNPETVHSLVGCEIGIAGESWLAVQLNQS
jgi:hypothetical protein